MSHIPNSQYMFISLPHHKSLTFSFSLALHHCMLPVSMAILKWSLFSLTKELISMQQAGFVLFLFAYKKRKNRQEEANTQKGRRGQRWKQVMSHIPNNLTTHGHLSPQNHWHSLSSLTLHHCMLPVRMGILKWPLFSLKKELSLTQQPGFVFDALDKKRRREWIHMKEKIKKGVKNCEELTFPTISKCFSTTNHWHFLGWLYTMLCCLWEGPSWSCHSSHWQRSKCQLSKQGLVFTLSIADTFSSTSSTPSPPSPQTTDFLSRMALHHFLLPVRMAILKWSLFSSTKEQISMQWRRFLFVFLLTKKDDKRTECDEEWEELHPNNLTRHISISSTPSSWTPDIPFAGWLYSCTCCL